MVNEVLGNDRSLGVNGEFEAMPLGNYFSFFLASLVLVMRWLIKLVQNFVPS